MASRRPFIQQEAIQENTTKGEALKLRPLYYGWVLVGALGMTTVVSYGTTQYLFGVLVIPVSDTFHWNRASISGAYALSALIAGL